MKGGVEGGSSYMLGCRRWYFLRIKRDNYRMLGDILANP